MYGVNIQESQLGLYQLQDVVCPENISGLGDQQTNNIQHLDQERADRMWEALKTAIQQIQRKKHSSLKFEELYRYGYYLVLHKYGGLLYTGLHDVIHNYISNNVQSKVMANLNKNFLNVINNTWDHHQTCMAMIRDILMYVDRTYIYQNGLDDIYTLGLNLFKDLVVCYGSIQTHLQVTLLALVTEERNGQLVDRPAFRCITSMLRTLGNGSLNVYIQNFEQPFLRQSADFFRIESQMLLEENNAALYFRRVDFRIREETETAQHCFEEETLPRLIQVAEDELIKAHMETVVQMSQSGVVHMLQQQQTEDLSRAYRLLSRVSNGLKTMFNCISHYLREQGQLLTEDEQSNNNAIIYIQNLLDLKDKIDYCVLKSFPSDKLYKQVIASDFEHIINSNPRSPELLSLFIDDKLKKMFRGMTDDDKIILLEKTMVLFRFLQDKDLFEQYYKQCLAKRLLLKTVNEENEQSVIHQMKAECGLHYTRKMEGMFRDIWSSAIITEEFRKHVIDTGALVLGLDTSVRVLTDFYWPTNNVSPPCSLPPIPDAAFEAFRKFYSGRHCGRQLTLLPQLGWAEVEADLGTDRELRRYTLQVSTYQMCLLMLFNTRTSWSFHEIHEQTNISRKDLRKSLQSLIMGKSSQRILTKTPETQQIETGDFFYINSTFTSKYNRIKISPYPVKCESESERQDTIKRVNEDRNHEVEAAIIRIMKARRAMNHEELVKEVISMLTPRFIPSRDMVKKRVEVLIEREYITRNPQDRRLYEYVA